MAGLSGAALPATSQILAGCRKGPKSVVVLQHVLPDTLQFLAHLQESGWKILQLIAIPYSARPENIEAAKRLGINVLAPQVITEDLLTSVLMNHASGSVKFAVHEVGGYFAPLMSNREVTSQILGVVEETKQGLWRYNWAGGSLQVPVVQIADNYLKRIEGEFVGRAIAELVMTDCMATGLSAPVIGIVGLGDIGAGVARSFLRNQCDVRGFDTQPARMLAAAAQGVKCMNLTQLLGQCDVIVGATGTGAFEPESLGKLQDRALLVSASSRRIEFPVEELSNFKVVGIQGLVKTYQVRGKRVRLMYDGAPANFSGKSLPLAFADLMFSQIAVGLNSLLTHPGESGITGLGPEDLAFIADSWWKFHGGTSGDEENWTFIA